MKIETNPIPPHYNIQRNFLPNLVECIIRLDKQINQPNSGSEYHRWYIRRVIEDRRIWRNVYNRKRLSFNEYTVDEMVSKRKECELRLENEIPYLDLLMERSVAMWNETFSIDEFTDFIELKSITTTLPTLEDLYSDDSLLNKILSL